jgi:heme-degrading monooxygenase HmoA
MQVRSPRGFDGRDAVIVRLWHGWTRPEDAEAYEEYVLGKVFPSMREIDGFIDAELVRRAEPDETAYVALTRFESLEAVRRFAGEDYERAVVEPEGRRLLTRFDERSTHYEIVERSSPPTSARS